MKPGRNDPCPCGSGKKYKQCCLAAADARAHSPEQLAWRRVRSELDGLPGRMLRFVDEHYGPEAVDEAWHEFNLWDDQELAFDPDTPHIPVFMPWMLHRWSPDPDETEVANAALHRISPTRAYLERHAGKLSAVVREYLASCLAQPFSFFEVLRCEQGQGFTLGDLLTGQSHEVLERGASQSVQVHDVLFGQLVTAQGLTLLEATSPIALPPDDKLAIIELRKGMQEAAIAAGAQGQLGGELWDIELRSLYLELTAQHLSPSLPLLRNADGEDIEFHKLVFQIDAAGQVFELLGQADFRACGMRPLPESAEHTADGQLRQAQVDWLKTDNPDAEEPCTLLGTLRIQDNRLTAEVNSRERADALKALLGGKLGAHARFRLDEVQTPEQAMAAQDRTTAVEPIPQDEPELQAMLSEYLERHYRTWMDTALPALNGRTPREAVADPDGREQVRALLQRIERDGQRNQPAVDPSIMRMLREGLGLEEKSSRAD